MPLGSQGVLVPSSSSSMPRSTPHKTRHISIKHPLASPDVRPPKRRKPSPVKGRGKENVKEGRMDDGEAAMMADLLAGLDASAFEDFGSSPVKSQRAFQRASPRRIPRTPLGVKVENTPVREPRRIGSSPSAKGKAPMKMGGMPEGLGVVQVEVKKEIFETDAPGPSILHKPETAIKEMKMEGMLEGLGVVQVKVKKETLENNAPGPSVLHKPEATINVKTVKEEPSDLPSASQASLGDDAFEFEFDLSDLAGMDDESLTTRAAEVKYPILNPEVPEPPSGYSPTAWARCVVEAVHDGICTAAGEAISAQDGVGASSSFLGKPIVLTFKDPNSYLIHHPDLMLTMTSIANAMPCPRKPILQSLIKVTGPQAKPMLYGNLQHALLQHALSTQSFDPDETSKRLDEELHKESTKLEIWGAGMNIEDVREELGARVMRGFEVFRDKWIGPTPDGELHSMPGEDASLLAISGLHDVEEDIWSPKWGLKGKVDASVQASILRSIRRGEKELGENVAPLEIKTGRAVGVMAHRAQTMLYTLLMEDRYGLPVPAGLLYYSQLDSILRVEAKQNEIRALILARNELASWLVKQRRVPGISSKRNKETPPSIEADVEEAFLPPTVDQGYECKNCYQLDSCMLYRKVLDEAPESTKDPIGDLFDETTSHMTKKDSAFFTKWDTLITVEEQELNRFRSQLWTMTALDREKTGRCFSDMIISEYSNDIGKSLAKIHRHKYTFVRDPNSPSHTSLLSGHIAKGDPVNISIDPDVLCLNKGFVLDLAPDKISIGVTYVIDTAALLKRTSLRHHRGPNDVVKFRIDKDEMSSGMMKMRNNLAQLFFLNGDKKRRELIVDLRKPYFEPARAPSAAEIPASLNVDQAKAMEKVLTARDYALILGMPGTGKTTTIAEIIKALVERGKTVLLTSYTHSAVDTILMKLLNAEFGVLRLGNVDKVHPDVQHLTLEAMDTSRDMHQLDQRLMSPPVVATTCLSIDHQLFFRRKFDYCIVDEASQITLPTCLGPLRMADTFVLVGDHFQLPPIVRNSDARRGGLDVSLFKTLSEAHPSAVVDLRYQYRMNEDIMLLSNRLIYENKLVCGNDKVAQQALKLDRKACAEVYDAYSCKEECWVQDLLDEKLKAVFVDTDLVPAQDSKVGDLVHNQTEANLVAQLATALTASGLKQEDLAVITPYRQQIKLLTGLFRDMSRVEILTADKSQGRDKDCILISLVRSNDVGNIGDLLKDWRRINVSFTRAKRKLVIFGSRQTLQRDCLLAGFIKLMDEKGWIYQLKPGADALHETKVKSQEVKREGEDIVKQEKRRGAGIEGILKGRPLGREIMSEVDGNTLS